MTSLPFDRYTGAETFCATDHDGKQFYAFQGPNNTGKLVMVENGVAKDITPAHILGRPSLEVNPLVGLWLIGNQEVPANVTPPRYPVAEYTPWPMPSAPDTR